MTCGIASAWLAGMAGGHCPDKGAGQGAAGLLELNAKPLSCGEHRVGLGRVEDGGADSCASGAEG